MNGVGGVNFDRREKSHCPESRDFSLSFDNINCLCLARCEREAEFVSFILQKALQLSSIWPPVGKN